MNPLLTDGWRFHELERSNDQGNFFVKNCISIIFRLLEYAFQYSHEHWIFISESVHWIDRPGLLRQALAGDSVWLLQDQAQSLSVSPASFCEADLIL